VATPLPSFQGLIGLIEMRAFTSQERAFRNAAQGQAYHQAGVILEALFSSEQKRQYFSICTFNLAS